MKEIWRDIKGYNGLYQISNIGRVKSLPKIHNLHNNSYITKERILKNSINSNGYIRITLKAFGKGKRYYVHRLVLEAFMPNPSNKPFVNHIDCNPKNNRVDNLEWCSAQENTDHMKKLGRNKRTTQWLNNLHKSQEKFYKKVKGTNIITGEIMILNNINSAKKYGFSPAEIIRCCKNKRNTTHNFRWEYV